jgi:hypothetical protein
MAAADATRQRRASLEVAGVEKMRVNVGAAGGRAGTLRSAGSERAEKQLIGQVQDLFVGGVEVPLRSHISLLRDAQPEYVSTLLLLVHRGLALPPAAKARCLAACWATGQSGLASWLLERHTEFGLPEVLRAVKLLDAGRKHRALRRRADRLRAGANPNHRKVSAAESQANDLQTILTEELSPETASLSGAVQKRVRSWVRSVPAERLEFWMLSLPAAPWTELADLCHFNPNDFAAPWFLGVAHGSESLPEGSMAATAEIVTEANVASILETCQLPYSFLRRRFPAGSLPDAAKLCLATYMPMDQLIWYYEDGTDSLACPGVDTIIDARLQAGERPDALSAGKLMERLMTFSGVGVTTDTDTLHAIFPHLAKPICATALQAHGGDLERAAGDLFERTAEQAQQRYGQNSRYHAAAGAAAATAPVFLPRLMPVAEQSMAGLVLPLDKPVCVIGDASASMQVAVSTASILGGLIAAVSDADLRFFNRELIRPAVVPRSVAEVLQVARATVADGSTCPAAALHDLLETKTVVKSFVVVTDEEENETFGGLCFHELMRRYVDEVYPAQITFVSFLSDPNAKGQMCTALESVGLEPAQFKFARERPDLTKVRKTPSWPRSWANSSLS